MDRRALLRSALVALPALGLGGRALAASASATAPLLAPSRQIPNPLVLDQDGVELRFFDDLIRGKAVMINFMYVKCEGICPMQTHNLLRVQKMFGDAIGRDLFMYSITLKPHEDGPAELKRYMAKNHVGPGWRFLTGSAESIETLRRGLGFTDPDPEIDKVTSNHIGIVRYGHEPLGRWSACPALSAPAFIAYSVRSVLGPAERFVPGPV